MTHTPGPWKVSTKRGPLASKGFTDPPAVMNGNGEYVAVLGGGSVHFANAHANARLIAAAPDLLEALQAILSDYTDWANSGDAGFWNPEQAQEVIQARAAIAKATEVK